MEFSAEQQKAIKELLYKMADDQLILGHRNSEWTGLGPLLEEDIAFSSMAQDKLGQALAIYTILQELGEKDPDAVAFTRKENEYRCCQFVEYPIGEYDFSLMRHFLFDHAEALRFEMLADSSFEPISKVARKFKGELKYHLLHADIWIEKLCAGTEESKARMQSTLNACWNLALGIFEPGPHEKELNEAGIFAGEEELKAKWLETVLPILEKNNLHVPSESEWKPALGGRNGIHTEHLQPLLNEMQEVFSLDPGAEW